MSKDWFGKTCTFLIAQWEENEITGGPDYQEVEPSLTFCNHPDNKNEYEGNCNRKYCPL